MGGLIKSDFKKLFRNKSLIICSIIAFIFAGISVFSMYMSYEMLLKSNEMLTADDAGMMAALGMEDLIEEFMKGNNTMSIINTLISDSSIYIFIAIAVCVFVGSEYTMGTLKNTVSRGFSRNQIYLSKVITVSVASFILTSVYVLGIIISAFIFAENSDNFNIMQTVVEFLVYTLLTEALAMMFLMIATVLQRTGISIAVCIAVPTLVNLIITMFAAVSDKIIDYIRFWLPSTFTLISTSYTDNTLFIPIVVALVYIALTYFAGSLVFSKKDIK